MVLVQSRAKPCISLIQLCITKKKLESDQVPEDGQRYRGQFRKRWRGHLADYCKGLIEVVREHLVELKRFFSYYHRSYLGSLSNHRSNQNSLDFRPAYIKITTLIWWFNQSLFTLLGNSHATWGGRWACVTTSKLGWPSGTRKRSGINLNKWFRTISILLPVWRIRKTDFTLTLKCCKQYKQMKISLLISNQ